MLFMQKGGGRGGFGHASKYDEFNWIRYSIWKYIYTGKGTFF